MTFQGLGFVPLVVFVAGIFAEPVELWYQPRQHTSEICSIKFKSDCTGVSLEKDDRIGYLFFHDHTVLAIEWQLLEKAALNDGKCNFESECVTQVEAIVRWAGHEAALNFRSAVSKKKKQVAHRAPALPCDISDAALSLMACHLALPLA